MSNCVGRESDDGGFDAANDDDSGCTTSADLWEDFFNEMTAAHLCAGASANAVVRRDAPPMELLLPDEPDGAWLDDGPPTATSVARAPPAPDGRLATAVASWGLERMGELPPQAAICFERAHARVQLWRNDDPRRRCAHPPLELLRAIVHDQQVPTMVASSGDHAYLVGLGRWASVTELMRLFRVPSAAPVWRELTTTGGLTPTQAAGALGRAVDVVDAFAAIAAALDAAPPTTLPVTYAAGCAGLDLFAAAMDLALTPDGWTYVTATESRPEVRAALTRAYACRGLTPEHVTPDARDETALTRQPPVHLWVCGPPCEQFSRRNRARVPGDVAAATADTARMLTYPRIHRPPAIVIENVDEPDARAAVTAAASTLPGYAWQTYPTPPRPGSRQARARRFWIGTRRVAPPVAG